MWTDTPGTNLLDSGAHFYEVYECADGGFIAVGALEPQFYAKLLELMELDPDEFPQMDQARWPELKERFAAVFRTKTRDEWAAILEPAEACATPVLGMGEARRATPTTPPAAASSRSAASSSPGRRRASAAPRPACRRRRRSPAPTPSRRSLPGGSRAEEIARLTS